MDDSNNPILPPEPVGLRRLRMMVMILTGTLTVGFLIIVGLMVATFSRPPTTAVALPETLSVPRGESAQAFTRGDGWLALVTTAPDGPDRIRIYSVDGTERQVIEITP